MKLKVVLAALLLAVMISCKSKTAFDYSQAIVKMETELSADIAIADQKVSKFLDSRQNDSAIIFSQQMEDLADRKLKEVQKLDAPDVEEGENFKKAAVRYFAYIKSIYTSFNKYTMAATDDEKETERQKLAKIVKEKAAITTAMQEAQRKFAAANNFKIEKVKSEKKSE